MTKEARDLDAWLQARHEARVRAARWARFWDGVRDWAVIGASAVFLTVLVGSGMLATWWATCAVWGK